MKAAPGLVRMMPAFAPEPVPALAVNMPALSDRVALGASCTLSTVSFTPEVTVKADPTASRMASSDAPGIFPPLQSVGLVKLPLISFSQWILDMARFLSQLLAYH